MENTLYFAYGSNINLGQMEYRCPDASVVGPVVLDGYELLFRRGGFATIAPKEGEQVQGLLWSITQSCERSLDRYEGYPRFYDKRMVTVRDAEGRSLSVMAYIMDERFREPMLPTDTYYNGILEGITAIHKGQGCRGGGNEYAAGSQTHDSLRQPVSPGPPAG